MTIKVERLTDAGILPIEPVIVTQTNHIVEIQYMARMNEHANIKKLDKDHYVDLRTGEVQEFKHFSNRADSFNSLRQTFKKLRYLINNNFTGAANEKFLTLTYAENMQDRERLMHDFQKFMQKLNYSYKDFSSVDYLSVVEPQARGAWHMHVLMRFNDIDTVYLDGADLRRLWPHGFHTVKSLRDVDNIGAYVSAYLTDMELTDNLANDMLESPNLNTDHFTGGGIEFEVKKDGKKYAKGARLHFYPPGINLYRKSKGIKEPERQRMKYDKIKGIVGSHQPHYATAFRITDQESDFANTIIYEQYNLKRDV